MSKSRYDSRRVQISDSQLGKLKEAVRKREGTTLELSKSDLGKGDITLPFTAIQIKKLNAGGKHRITFSKTALSTSSKSGGSFFSSLGNFFKKAGEETFKVVKKGVNDPRVRKVVERVADKLLDKAINKATGSGARGGRAKITMAPRFNI